MTELPPIVPNDNSLPPRDYDDKPSAPITGQLTEFTFSENKEYYRMRALEIAAMTFRSTHCMAVDTRDIISRAQGFEEYISGADD